MGTSKYPRPNVTRVPSRANHAAEIISDMRKDSLDSRLLSVHAKFGNINPALNLNLRQLIFRLFSPSSLSVANNR